MLHSHCLIFLTLFPVLLLAGTIQPSGPARPAAPPPEQCVQDIELTPDTWKKLEMDNYIASIEGIDKMTLIVAYSLSPSLLLLSNHSHLTLFLNSSGIR